MSDWQLAQLNIARPLAPLDTPQLAEFVALLAPINALADVSPGFVWRLQDATGVRVEDPSIIVNMSVWQSAELLFDFVYKSAHTQVMARRREWFSRISVFQVLWWIPAGQVPTVEEGMQRLATLERSGPTPEAFTFKMPFPAPGQPGDPGDMRPEPYCSP